LNLAVNENTANSVLPYRASVFTAYTIAHAVYFFYLGFI